MDSNLAEYVAFGEDLELVHEEFHTPLDLYCNAEGVILLSQEQSQHDVVYLVMVEVQKGKSLMLENFLSNV